MIDPIVGAAAGAAAGAASKSIIDSSIGFFNRVSKNNFDKFKAKSHQDAIFRWAERIQVFRMASALDTIINTIGLSISGTPRRLSKGFSRDVEVSEAAMLTAGKNIVILGDPGAGKTTLVKRLICLQFSDSDRSLQHNLRYPIRVLLRELPRGHSVFAQIAENLGFEVKIHKVDETFRFYVGERSAEDVVVEAINKNRVAVFLDGLDETQAENATQVALDISSLAMRVREGQLIVTCRSGEFDSIIEGLDVYELVPLGWEQIGNIVRKTLDDADRFLAELKKAPYKDLADRPLFLIFLICIFTENSSVSEGRVESYLPDKPTDIYREVVLLALKNWDESRKIERLSKYGEFRPEDKMKFLGLLAYELSISGQLVRFDREFFREFYAEKADLFKLPIDQADQVAAEIESHGGILVESSWQSYEFSHVSLQEFLSAQYWMEVLGEREGLLSSQESLGTLGVAAALSSDPDLFLFELLYSKESAVAKSFEKTCVVFRRLIAERPDFGGSLLLGYAFLKIFDAISKRAYRDREDGRKLERLALAAIEDRLIRSAVREGLGKYSFLKSNLQGDVPSYRVEDSVAEYSPKFVSARRFDWDSKSEPYLMSEFVLHKSFVRKIFELESTNEGVVYVLDENMDVPSETSLGTFLELLN